MKISVEQLKQLNKEEYILIDIRDAEEAFKIGRASCRERV